MGRVDASFGSLTRCALEDLLHYSRRRIIFFPREHENVTTPRDAQLPAERRTPFPPIYP
jgi:hypothetical protein